MKNRLVNSSLYRLMEKVVVVTTSLVLTPILISQLGAEDYGLWILVLATLGWFNVFELGCPTAVQREQAIAIEHDNNQLVNELYSSSVLLFAGLGCIAVTAISLLSMAPQVLGVMPEYHGTTSLAIQILAIKVFWDFVANAIHGVYSGHLRFDIDAKINTAFTILKSITMVFAAIHYGVMGLVLATVVIDFLTQLLKFILAYKLQPSLRFSLSFVRKAYIVRLIQFSKFIIVYDLSKVLNGKSSPIIASHLFNLSAVAVFNIADRLARQIETAIVSLLGIFQPYFVRESTKKQAIDEKLFFVVDLFCFFSAILFVPLMLLSPSFIYLWIGDGFSQSSDILQVLCLAFMAKVVSQPVMDVLIATAKHKAASISVVLGSLINVLLAIVLGREFGLIGIAFALLLSQILFEGLSLCYFSATISKQVRVILLVKLVRVLAFYSLCYGINKSLFLIGDRYDWLTFSWVALACFCFVAIASWFLFLDQRLRRLLSAQVGDLLKP